MLVPDEENLCCIHRKITKVVVYCYTLHFDYSDIYIYIYKLDRV